MASTTTDRATGVNAGKAIKVPCLTASTGALTLAGEQTIDGIACTSLDRVLVKNQATSVGNGIWVVSTGTWSRAPDWDGVNDVTEGTRVDVNQGAVNATTTWRVTTTGDITPGVTAVVFSLVETGDIAPLEADIAALESDVSSLQSDTATNASDISSNAADTATLTSDLTTTDTQVDTNIDDIQDSSVRISLLEAKAHVHDDPLIRYWAASINPNRLYANVAVVNYDGSAWAHTVDTTTDPVYPGDFTVSSTPPIQIAANTYEVTETWRFYQYDGTVIEILPQNGISGIDITPTDTLGPVWAAGGYTVDDSGNYSITPPTDNESGLAAAETYDIYIDDVLYLAKFTETTGTVSAASGTHTTYAAARDESGNVGLSDVDTFTIATQNIGTVGFTDTSHQFGEDDGTYAVELSRTGTGSFDVDVSIIEDTALDTTTDAVNGQFTRIAGTTINFVGASADEDVTITLSNDTGASDINQAYMVIDWESGTNNVQVGQESTRLLIEGSGVTVDGGYQMDTTTPFALTVEAESTANGGTRRNSIASGKTSDSWDEVAWRTVGTYLISTGSANEYGNDTTLDIEAPYAEYELSIKQEAINVNGGGDGNLFDLFMRQICNGAGGEECPTHASLVRTVASISVDGAGLATVTLDRDHGGFAGTETIYFEDLEGADSAEYNVTAGLTANAAAAGATFTISGMTASGVITSATGNLLGADQYLIGNSNPANTTANSGGRWRWAQIGQSDQMTMYIADAGTWYFRVYMQENTTGRYDRFTIVPRDSAWNGNVTNVNVAHAGFTPLSHDDEGGLVESTYSAGAGGAPEADENNNPILILPLPTTTVEPLECT